MEVDRSILLEETCVKKQRVDGAVLDFELSQLQPCAAVAPEMVSPVTAFSQLNFNRLSPLCESPSPASKCDAGGHASASLTSSTAGVVIRLGSKHYHGRLKRPLSGPPSETQPPAPTVDCGSAKRTLARPKSITLPTTIQPVTTPAQGFSAPSRSAAVQSSSTRESTSAADSEIDADQNIPVTSAPQTTVDQHPINCVQ